MKREKSYFANLISHLKQPAAASQLNQAPISAASPLSPTISPTVQSPAAPPTPPSTQISPDVVNAILGRFFWNLHDAPEFAAFLSRKINKKFTKLKKPSVLVCATHKG